MIGKFGTLVLYAVMARVAGLEAFGDFTTAASLSILLMIAAFGMDYRVTRLVARGEDGVGEAFWSAIALKAFLSLGLFALLLGVAVLGPYDDRVVFSTVLLGLAILVELMMLTPHAVFRGLEQLRPVAFALIIYRGTLAAVGTGLLLAGASIVAVAAGWLGAALLALAYTVRQLRGAGLALPRSVTARSMRTVGADSFGLGLAGVLGAVLARLDVVILGLLKDSDAVAVYGGAYRLMESTQILTTAVALAIFPVLTRLGRTTSPTLGEASGLAGKAMLAVTLPVAGVLILYAEPVLRLVYGPAFAEQAGVLRLLGPVVTLAGALSLMSFVLTSQRRQRPIIIVFAASTVVNVVTNLALVPGAGAEGAALAWVITSLALAGGLLGATLSTTGPVPLLRTAGGPVAALAAMIAVGLILGEHLLAAGPALLVFGVCLAAIERLAFPQDTERLLRAVRRRHTPAG